MPVTLLEASKLETGNIHKQAIMEFYAGSSDILLNLPFDSIAGGSMKYDQEDTLPGIGFRGINEGYTESAGVINPQVESLVIAGGDLDVDKFIIQTRGVRTRAAQEKMKTRALGLKWAKTFLKGDTSSAPKEFDGLQVRLVGGQLIVAGTTSGGDALALTKMDQLIDQVIDPTHLIMSKAMARKFAAAGRLASVSGYVNWLPNQLGERIMTYNGLPILTVDLDNAGTAILPFTEANPSGGTAASTSIYCVSFTENGVMGLQNGSMNVDDLGEQNAKPVMRTRVEWYSSFAVFNGRGAARLHGIKDAAITA